MDYAEEQENEIMALESIYFDEFHVIGTDPNRFEISVEGDPRPDESDPPSCTLSFTLPATYPDAAPTLSFSESRGLSQGNLNDLSRSAAAVAAEEKGVPMVYTIVECVKARLNEDLGEVEEMVYSSVVVGGDIPLDEPLVFEGEAVTRENFTAWKAAFDAERALRAAGLGNARNAGNAGNVGNVERLTGRQLFEKDQSLLSSEFEDDDGAGAGAAGGGDFVALLRETRERKRLEEEEAERRDKDGGDVVVNAEAFADEDIGDLDDDDDDDDV